MTQSAIWFTSGDGIDHAVTDDAMEAGLAAGTGEFVAVCGTAMLAAPLAQPPGAHCPSCVAFLRARESLRDLPARLHERRPGLLARLLCRHHAPADAGSTLSDALASAGSTHRRARHAA